MSASQASNTKKPSLEEHFQAVSELLAAEQKPMADNDNVAQEKLILAFAALGRCVRAHYPKASVLVDEMGRFTALRAVLKGNNATGKLPDSFENRVTPFFSGGSNLALFSEHNLACDLDLGVLAFQAFCGAKVRGESNSADVMLNRANNLDRMHSRTGILKNLIEPYDALLTVQAVCDSYMDHLTDPSGSGEGKKAVIASLQSVLRNPNKTLRERFEQFLKDLTANFNKGGKNSIRSQRETKTKKLMTFLAQLVTGILKAFFPGALPGPEKFGEGLKEQVVPVGGISFFHKASSTIKSELENGQEIKSGPDSKGSGPLT